MTTATTKDEPERLVKQHLALVKHIALGLRQQLPADLELDDLISWGVQGMLEAAERFEGEKGAAFSTFAYYRIRGSMIDGLRASGRLPRSEIAKVRMLERVDDYLENAAAQERGAAPESLARRSTSDVLGQIARHVSAITTVCVVSLEGSTSGELPDESATQSFDRLDTRGFASHLAGALESLDDKERRLVKLCYFGDCTLTEAGRKLGMSRSWASRIHVRAIHKLQSYFAKRDRAVPEPPPLEES
ncbi:MAG: sigma-70 family RNA polymerase sigma factor [Polyangia bacterium]|jgi:RNA polymerase sigma factor for flagellar operon FliA|nr:sigma-70 family RNA polymerase sigma factor [Polyangia bacterium]